MPGTVLTTLSTVQCPHGGLVQLTTTANALVQVDGGFALLESDVHPVVGCPFATAAGPSPCTTVQWSGGSTETKVNQIGVLTQSSIGQCIGPAGVQGLAVIANTQVKANTTA